MSSSLFNFKSSGTKTDDRKFKKETSVLKPIGFKTPLQEGGDIFEMHVNPIKQLSDNFRNMIMTNNGERLGRYNFGANLRPLVFEYASQENFESIITEQIVDATNRHIPLIQIVNVEKKEIDRNIKNEYNEFGVALITIKVEYTIPKLQSPVMALEIDFNVGG